MDVLNPGEEFAGREQAATPDDVPGYVVGAPLGQGGSATVFRAHPVAAGGEPGQVALKVLGRTSRTPEGQARLEREYRFARALDHEHVVAMYGHGPGWLAMQIVDGGTVAGLPTVGLRLRALAQVAGALDYAHGRGIVHCDVKPSNILVFKDFPGSGAMLIDFGSAHDTAGDLGERPVSVRASLPYAAPELLGGRQPCAATDEYALACTVVELVTGEPPFRASTPIGLVDAQLHRAPPKIAPRIAWVPHAFDSILAKALAKNPDSRYETCSELVRLIVRVLR